MTPNEISVKASDEMLSGKYANVMNISHTPDEFILDFISVVPAARTAGLSARVITSPGHFKRILAAFEDNLKRYEEKFGNIKTADEPDNKSIGFQS